ncbi:polysaccharide lyase family 7 protein [Nevskia ramosa]|uniref:polysaccharide lyase family 7 protein n=1 Tax=Nevskia ramosa TaxID=64002 RepID=UPI0003B4448F|nr:polysaccharide lyase family 7 protein [Nevskia ramosa]
MPVDEDGSDGADEIPASELANYSSIYWFNPSSGQLAQSGFRATGGETVFWTPVNGNGRTGDSDFPRTEMREQLELGNNRVNWRLTGTHIQRGTVTITRMPTPLTSGRTTLLFFAQMHSVDNSPPVKLVFQRAPDGTTTVYGNYNLRQRTGVGENSDIQLPMAIGTKFSYEIRVVDGTVTTTINGKVIDRRDLRPAWLFQEFYFKAGNYLGNNTSTASGYGEVVYSSIQTIHQ